jgi:hypothetical protein
MSLAHIVSKILAGGLTAGVFLLWWPRHFPDTGTEGLVIRGLAWTMSFELLLVTFSRVEDMVVRRVGSRLHPRRERVRARIETAPPRLRSGSAVALACVGLAAPLAMLSEVAQHPLREEPKTKVVKQVIVRTPVVRREVVVKEVVAAAPAQARPDAGLITPSATPAVAPQPSVRRSAPARTRAAAPKPSTPKADVGEEKAAQPAAPTVTTVPVSGTAPAAAPAER